MKNTSKSVSVLAAALVLITGITAFMLNPGACSPSPGYLLCGENWCTITLIWKAKRTAERVGRKPPMG